MDDPRLQYLSADLANRIADESAKEYAFQHYLEVRSLLAVNVERP